jgi:hypothetical protein
VAGTGAAEERGMKITGSGAPASQLERLIVELPESVAGQLALWAPAA